jgi:hypothetical protein
MKQILLVSFLFFLLAGCDEQLSQPGSLDPYQQWMAKDIHDYTMEQVNVCFCAKGGTKMLLTVRADTIAQVMNLTDSTILPHNEAVFYRSVKDLFTIIRTPGKDSLVFRFNSQYGYPEMLDINPQDHPVDGGVLIESSNLKVN